MYYSAEIAVDHITDHLPFRSTRKQWIRERRRVRFSERKGAEKAIFSGNCPYRSVWDQEARSSSLRTSTKTTESRVHSPLSVIFLYLFRCFTAAFREIIFPRPHNQIWTKNSFFFVYSGAKIKSCTIRFLVGFCCQRQTKPKLTNLPTQDKSSYRQSRFVTSRFQHFSVL